MGEPKIVLILDKCIILEKKTEMNLDEDEISSTSFKSKPWDLIQFLKRKLNVFDTKSLDGLI